MTSADTIRRIQPQDVPFSGSEMTDAEVDRLVSISGFDKLDPNYRDSKQFRNLLRTHARVVRCQQGDIICREGDWGHSAFLILSGTVVVEIESAAWKLPDEVLGRRAPKRKSFFQAVAQLWNNPRQPEYRDRSDYLSLDSRIGARRTGEDMRIYLQDVPAVLERRRHKFLEPGTFFGELAALGRTTRTATLFARDEVELLEFRWQGLRDMMRRDKGFRKNVDESYRQNALLAFLQSSPILEHLRDDEQAMQMLVQEAKLQTYGEYDQVGSFKKIAEEGAARGLENEPLIAQEGDHPHGAIMIRTGLARVSQRFHHGHRTISYLAPGQVFGLQEIIDGWKTSEPVMLQYSLRAIGFLTVVVLSTSLIEQCLLEREPSHSAPSNRQKVASGPRIDPARTNQEFLEFLMENRLVNGTATMLIDLDRCTRCDDCVRACASAQNNNPRFLRHGPVHDNVMVANACMHCQDPVCMIECPTGAIGRRMDEGMVTINDQTCVGCANCANNCPYDAIRMVEIRNEQGAFIRDENTQLPIRKATKCDLCVDQLGGPACQRACPHDALVRMDMGDFESLVEWRNR